MGGSRTASSRPSRPRRSAPAPGADARRRAARPSRRDDRPRRCDRRRPWRDPLLRGELGCDPALDAARDARRVDRRGLRHGRPAARHAATRGACVRRPGRDPLRGERLPRRPDVPRVGARPRRVPALDARRDPGGGGLALDAGGDPVARHARGVAGARALRRARGRAGGGRGRHRRSALRRGLVRPGHGLRGSPEPLRLRCADARPRVADRGFDALRAHLPGRRGPGVRAAAAVARARGGAGRRRCSSLRLPVPARSGKSVRGRRSRSQRWPVSGCSPPSFPCPPRSSSSHSACLRWGRSPRGSTQASPGS